MRLLVLLRFIPYRRSRGYLRFRHDVMGRWPTPVEMWAYLGWCWVNRIDNYGRSAVTGEAT